MKERLTGAIILVALVVLLVPELLTGPIRTRSALPAITTAAASPADGAARKAHAQPPLHTYTLTLGPSPAAADTAATQAQAAGSSPASSASAPAPTAGAPEERAGAAAEGRPDRDGPRQGTPEDAAPRASALQAAKPAAHPVLREAAASASSRGWVVQLGSFADRHNAVRLAGSLGARGFHMSVSPAKAGSRVLWRVRSRPVRDRTGAQRLAARLRALGHRGEVLPAS